MGKRVLMGLTFFPAAVRPTWRTTSRARCPPPAGRCASSRARASRPATRASFYEGLDVVAVDMTAAARAADPMAADPPMHASYEDREGAPDRVFAALDDAAYEHQVDAWARVLERRRRAPSTTSCTSTT